MFAKLTTTGDRIVKPCDLVTDFFLDFFGGFGYVSKFEECGMVVGVELRAADPFSSSYPVLGALSVSWRTQKFSKGGASKFEINEDQEKKVSTQI